MYIYMYTHTHTHTDIQVVYLKDMEAASPDTVRVVAQVLQKFLTDHPGALAVIIAASDRREVNELFRHYRPARPETVRAHFGYVMQLDRYTALQLMCIFRRQCESEQVRLSTSATDVMLERAFTLNFNFFDNTNGAGTRHLLKLARLEHTRRTGGAARGKKEGREGGGKKEGQLLESTDIQAAFQRLRRDWFAAHPDKTFTALMEMQAADKDLNDKQKMSKLLRRKSMDKDGEAANDAKLALEAVEQEEKEEEEANELDKWTLEDFRVFHESELKRQQEAHLHSLNREREECRIVVEQSTQGHAAALQRVMHAVRKNIKRIQASPATKRGFEVWYEAMYVVRRQRNIKLRASTQWRSRCSQTVFAGWTEVHRRRRRLLVRCRPFIDIWLCRKQSALFAAWHELVRARMQGTRERLGLWQGFVTNTILRQEATGMQAVDDWMEFVEEEQNGREQVFEQARREHARSDEVEQIKKRHHSELADWRYCQIRDLNPRPKPYTPNPRPKPYNLNLNSQSQIPTP